MSNLPSVHRRVNASGPQRLGDIIGGVLGRILRRGRRWQRPDPQAALLDRLSDDEVLQLLGPSWGVMTPDQRERYPDRWTVRDWAEVEARANLSQRPRGVSRISPSSANSPMVTDAQAGPLPNGREPIPDNSYVRLLTLPKPERVATVATWSLLRALDSWTALRGGAA